MTICNVCGVRTLSNSMNCPVCGAVKEEQSSSNAKEANYSIPASTATIDITAEDAD